MKTQKEIDHTKKSEWKLKKPLYYKRDEPCYKKYAAQLKKNGFSDTETYDLSGNIAKFILPRLIRFKEINNGYPGGEITEQKWDAMLDEMIFAFTWILYYTDPNILEYNTQKLQENVDRCNAGLQLFAKYFWHLGW